MPLNKDSEFVLTERRVRSFPRSLFSSFSANHDVRERECVGRGRERKRDKRDEGGETRKRDEEYKIKKEE